MAEKKRRPKPEYSKSAVKTLILFAVFIAVTCGAVMGAVVFLPLDLPASGPANTPGNLMNGGRAVIGDDRVYYTDSTGIYSFPDSEPDKQITVSEQPADRLFYAKGKIYYAQNGALYAAFFDGSLKTEVFSGFDDVQLIGDWLYYLRGGTLRKRRMDGGRDTELGLRPKQFYVISQTVYYLGEDGKIYAARTDGSQNRLFAGVSADRFMINGNYLFYSNEKEIRSLNMADRKTGDRLGDAGVFQVDGASFYYLKDGGLYLKDLSGKDSSSGAPGSAVSTVSASASAASASTASASAASGSASAPVTSGSASVTSGSGAAKGGIKKLADADADALYLCGDYLYFSKQNGAVSRVRSDGTEFRQLSAATK